MEDKFPDEAKELIRMAFIAGCESRNEGYQTISHEESFTKWYNELNERKFDEWVKTLDDDRN